MPRSTFFNSQTDWVVGAPYGRPSIINCNCSPIESFRLSSERMKRLPLLLRTASSCLGEIKLIFSGSRV
ncbi:Uncharacterised protein [Vibrio cholerae]|nr:Uncharacterised protein [Vibrio cholerae]